VNGQVVPRRLWNETNLTVGDDVRLVRAVAGGAPRVDDAIPDDPQPLVIAGRQFTSRLLVDPFGEVKRSVHAAMVEQLGPRL
jgi:hypothetical protein